MMVLSGQTVPKRVLDVDGTLFDVFSFPTDQASLEELLRDLFENHWREITFGVLIQGAAWEMKADRAPTRIGMLDGYLTVAFGVPLFTSALARRKVRAPDRRRPKWRAIGERRGPRFTAGSDAPARQCLGACSSSTARGSSR